MMQRPIDQSGLNIGFNSGVDDFDTYIAQNPTHTLVALNNEWFTPSNVSTATVTYDLGSVYQIDKLALWNEEASGINLFDILTSTDGLTFSALATGLSPVDNPLGSNYPVEVFNLSTTSAQFVRFDITSCPQNVGDFNSCAIGEVAFSTSTGVVPEPLTILGAGTAIGFGAAFKGKLGKKKADKA